MHRYRFCSSMHALFPLFIVIVIAFRFILIITLLLLIQTFIFVSVLIKSLVFSRNLQTSMKLKNLCHYLLASCFLLYFYYFYYLFLFFPYSLSTLLQLLAKIVYSNWHKLI